MHIYISYFALKQCCTTVELPNNGAITVVASSSSKTSNICLRIKT